MRLVMVSDTHGNHDQVTVPEGDVLIHAGDLTLGGTIHELKDAIGWLNHQPHKHKIFIGGNHDWCLQAFMTEQAEYAVHDMCAIGTHYLRDSEITLDGVKFYGSPWSPFFFDWAFNAHRGSQIREFWAKIPSDTDVLITHGPPLYILDHVGKEHVGCEDLRKTVDNVQPKVHVFGHIHCAYGQRVCTDINYFNAAMVDERNRIKNQPLVFDLACTSCPKCGGSGKLSSDGWGGTEFQACYLCKETGKNFDLDI